MGKNKKGNKHGRPQDGGGPSRDAASNVGNADQPEDVEAGALDDNDHEDPDDGTSEVELSDVDSPGTETSVSADIDHLASPTLADDFDAGDDPVRIEIADAAGSAGSHAVDTGLAGIEGDVRGVLIQIAGTRLLLPNATIAEVLSYAEPDAVEGTPDWLLGRMRWRGWQLPMVAFSRMLGIAASETGGLGSKVVVLRALGGNAQAPYFAMLTQGFPRLVTVSRDTLMVLDDGDALPPGVQARVQLSLDEALLPDLVAVENMINEVLAQAAAAAA